MHLPPFVSVFAFVLFFILFFFLPPLVLCVINILVLYIEENKKKKGGGMEGWYYWILMVVERERERESYVEWENVNVVTSWDFYYVGSMSMLPFKEPTDTNEVGYNIRDNLALPYCP